MSKRADTAATRSLVTSAQRALAGALLTLAATLVVAQSPSGDEHRPNVTATADGELLHLHWRIPQGTYLLASRLSLESLDPAVVLAPFTPPAGEPLDDPFFGTIQVLRREARAAVPFFVRAGGEPGAIRVAVTSQTCVDGGDCLPAETQDVSAPLPGDAPAAAAPAPGPATSALAALERMIGGAERSAPGASSPVLELAPDASGLQSGDEFLEPDEAFKVQVRMRDASTAVARWEIADGYYLYRDKFGASATDDDASAGALRMPAGKVKDDEYFGRVEVYYHEATAEIPIQHALTEGGTLQLELRYQGCADAGLCYPPITRTLALVVPPGGAGAGNAAGGPGAPVAASADLSAGAQATTAPPLAGVELPEQDRIAASLGRGSTWLVVATFFGFGLLLSFTPCVLPMVPILSSIIVGQGDYVTTRRAFALSAVYVLAMALTYTVAGVFAGLFGANLQAAFQSPWVLSTFSAVFVLLALSMFGLYDLQLPVSMQTALARISNRQAGGKFLGVAVMGLLSALIVGPCVAAPLAGALIYIGKTGDAVLGGVALFSLSLGMGAPLLVVGTSAGRLMPRAGPWMDAVKAVFGVMLLGVAIYLLERIVPVWVSMALWATLCIVGAIYLGALDALGEAASGWRRLSKGTGLVVLTYGVLLMVGAASGGGDVFQPLKGLTVGGPQREEGITFQRVKGPEGLRLALDAATRVGRPVMLDYYADWCVSCKEMEKYTFSDAGVVQALTGTVLLQADVTDNDEQDKALLKSHGLYGPPAILFFGPDGNERPQFRVVGFMEAEPFRRIVEQATGARQAAAEGTLAAR